MHHAPAAFWLPGRSARLRFRPMLIDVHAHFWHERGAPATQDNDAGGQD